MNNVRIFCDIDDTLWDLLPYWIEYNNIQYFSYYPDTPKCEYMTKDLNEYDNWDMSDKFSDDMYREKFYSFLSHDQLWDSIQVPKERINTLKKINELETVDLYIVTSMKPEHGYKLKKFKKVFPFIKDKQIITCHDKWLLDGSIWIDDKPETLEKCRKCAGGRTIKINKPYNKFVYSHLAVDDFSELYNNEEFYEMIGEVYNIKNESRIRYVY